MNYTRFELPAYSATYAKATTTYTAEGNRFEAYMAADHNRPLVGGQFDRAWMSALWTITNQRYHLDLGVARAINSIYYENSNADDTWMDRGAKNFVFQGSNTAADFADLTYANDGTWVTIQTGLQFAQHAAGGNPDPQYVQIDNTIPYRYYALKIADNWGSIYFVGMTRVILQHRYADCYIHARRDRMNMKGVSTQNMLA